MEYQKLMTLLDNKTIQTSKLRTKNWVEITDESREKNVNSNIVFKTSMIRSDLYNYSGAYTLSSGTITITREGDDDAAERGYKRNKGVTFEILCTISWVCKKCK